jgi:hypothetical protein
MARFGHSNFSVSKEGETTVLASELSTLEGNVPLEYHKGLTIMSTPSVFHQIYTDAADEGITVIGKSQEVDYVLIKVNRDEDGDLKFYELAPTLASIRKVPSAARTKVVIFND